MTDYMKYADAVISEKSVTGEYQRLSVQRHLEDLDRANRGEIPYKFSEKHAAHAIDFVHSMRHVKGRLAREKKHLILEPFQQFVWAVAFGWQARHEDTGAQVRRFTKIYVEKARKGGKTTEMAAIGNYGLLMDGEEGAEVYSAATTMTQAKEVFNISKSMLNKFKREHPYLSKDIECLKENISYWPTESKYEPVPNEPDTLDGKSPSFSLIDEMHAHKDDSLMAILETGMGARDNPLTIVITTAGYNIYGPCYQMRKTNIDVLRGIKQDDRSYSMIYTLDEDDDWNDKDTWVKANPNIGIAPYWSYMNDRYRKAKTDGFSAEINFKTKNLNKWTTTGATWIKDEEWMASGSEFDWEICLRRPCWVGMDLSTVKDLTCLVFFFPPHGDDDQYRTLCKFYCPADNAEERSKSDGVNYMQWGRDGYITLTAGPTVDYDYILRDLNDAKQKFDIQILEHDPALAHKLVEKIRNMGIEVSSYGQNCRDMEPPIFQIEKMIADKLLNHGNHPVLRWNVSNVMTYTDTNGNRKFDKKKVVERIDGCVALACAVGGYLTDGGPSVSKYETEDLGGV